VRWVDGDRREQRVDLIVIEARGETAFFFRHLLPFAEVDFRGL